MVEVKRNRDDVEGTVLDTHLVQVKTFFSEQNAHKSTLGTV